MSDCSDTFPPGTPSDPNQFLRYFNQPIEQIPGFDKSQPQILCHGGNAGLVWLTIATGSDSCIDVMSRLDTEGSLKIIVKKIRPLQILDDPNPIDVTECPTGDPT